MKDKKILLAVSLILCAASIALVLVKGAPKDEVSLDSVAEVAESTLHHIDKTAQIITSVSDAEEIEAGNKIHLRINRNFLAKNIEITPLCAYVNAVGRNVARHVKRRDIPYRFHIIDSYVPNAFCSAGGHIYITIGMLKLLESEAELAAVLGHEITHCDAKHAVGMIQHKILEKKILKTDADTLADIGYDIFWRPGYSEYQEEEADLGGVYLAAEAGYHPLAVIHAFKRIEDYYGHYSAPEAVNPLDDTLRAVGGLVERYFATHPLTPERISRIKNFIREKKLLANKSMMYIGQKNYIQRICAADKMFPDELRKKYSLGKGPDYEYAAKTDLEKLYTIYGVLYKGLGRKETEKILPKTLIKSKRPSLLECGNLDVYRMDTRDILETVTAKIYFKRGKISSIRIVKQKER